MLASFLCGEFLLHIPCWLHSYVGSFSYTSRAGLFLCGELLRSEICSEDNLTKGAGWEMAQEKSVKKSHSKERRKPYNTLNRTEQHQRRTEWKMATEKKGEMKKEMDPSSEQALVEKAKK